MEQAILAQAVAQLQEMLAQLPSDNINVRPHLEELRRLQDADAWGSLDLSQTEQLSQQIAPLLRFLPDVNLQVMTFEARCERLAVAHLAGQGEEVTRLQEHILEDLALLSMALQAVQAQAEKLAWVQSPGFWAHLDYERIMDMEGSLAPLMRYRDRRRPEMIELNLPDEIARRRWIIYGPSGEGAFADTYREQVEAAIKNLARNHPTLQKLRLGEAIEEADVQALASALNRPDLYISEQVLQEVYQQPDADLIDFTRYVLGLSRLPSREEQIKEAFDRFIIDHPQYTATQIRFIRAIRSAVLRQTRITAADLQRVPFIRIGDAHQLFSDTELTELLDFANRMAA